MSHEGVWQIFMKLIAFSFSIREPLDGQWGVPKENGNWTGIVGTLQHEMADFSLGLTPTYDRAQVIEFSRVYITEPMIIVSAKPQPLPNYLSLIRPFPGNSNLWTNDITKFFPVGVEGRVHFILYYKLNRCEFEQYCFPNQIIKRYMNFYFLNAIGVCQDILFSIEFQHTINLTLDCSSGLGSADA